MVEETRITKEMAEYATFIRGLTNDEYIVYVKANLAALPETDEINPKIHTVLVIVSGLSGMVLAFIIGRRGLKTIRL